MKRKAEFELQVAKKQRGFDMLQHAYIMMGRCSDGEEEGKKWNALYLFLCADDLATLIVPFLFGDYMFVPDHFDEIHKLAHISPAWKIAACKHVSCVEFKLSLHSDIEKVRYMPFPKLKRIILYNLADLRDLLTFKCDLSMVEAIQIRSREISFIEQKMELDTWKMFFRQRKTEKRYIWFEAKYEQRYGWLSAIADTGFIGHQFTEEMVDEAISRQKSPNKHNVLLAEEINESLKLIFNPDRVISNSDEEY